MLPNATAKPLILIVDDNAEYRKFIIKAFDYFFTFEEIVHPSQILQKLQLLQLEEKTVHLILLDFDFSGTPAGLKFLNSEKYKLIEDKKIPVILITAFGRDDVLPREYDLTPDDLHCYGQIPKLYKSDYDYTTWERFIQSKLTYNKVKIYVNYANKKDFDQLFPNIKGLVNSLKQSHIEVDVAHSYTPLPSSLIDEWKNLHRQADIVLHLVCSDLLAAEDHTVAPFTSSDQRNIPILMRACIWEYHTILNQLIPLPANGEYLINGGKLDENLCLQVIKGIKKVIEEIIDTRLKNN